MDDGGQSKNFNGLGYPCVASIHPNLARYEPSGPAHDRRPRHLTRVRGPDCPKRTSRSVRDGPRRRTGIGHPFMTTVATGLQARGVATFQYQFPYMETRSKRPDRPPIAQATVRAAVEQAARLFPGISLVAGGKSFGSRMTTQAQAVLPLAGVIGLVAFGFPLHAAGKPSDDRARHLADISIPMLFLQGDRDALADTGLLLPAIRRLGAPATLHLLSGADHSFGVLARSGGTNGEVMAEALDVMVGWLTGLVTNPIGR